MQTQKQIKYKPCPFLNLLFDIDFLSNGRLYYFSCHVRTQSANTHFFMFPVQGLINDRLRRIDGNSSNCDETYNIG